jgi:hypothetical protein
MLTGEIKYTVIGQHDGENVAEMICHECWQEADCVDCAACAGKGCAECDHDGRIWFCFICNPNKETTPKE